MWSKKIEGSFDENANPPVVEQIYGDLKGNFGNTFGEPQAFGWLPEEGDSQSPYIEVRFDSEPNDIAFVEQTINSKII